VAAFGILALAACKKDEPAPADLKPAADGSGIAGTYKSNWGPTAFTAAGANVTASYTHGTTHGSMACTATGPVMDCTWQEGTLAGKAKLTKMSDGSIRGTWGSKASATDGGNWTFTQ
jgi:hypothetical protein